MAEISDVLRTDTGIMFNLSVNTDGEILIENEPPALKWTDATLSSASWTDASYSSASWTDYSY